MSIERLKRVARCCVCALLVTLFALGPDAQPAQAQLLPGLVYDPRNHITQVQRQLQEVSRWIATVEKYRQDIEHYIQMYNKAVETATRLTNIMDIVDEELAKHKNLVRLTRDIGRIIRSGFQLRDDLRRMVYLSARTLRDIENRWRQGIFDWAADKRDLETYLQQSIGRRSEDTLTRQVRLAQRDSELARMLDELQQVQKKLAELNGKLTQLQEDFEREMNRSDRDQGRMDALNQQLVDHESQIDKLEERQNELLGMINERMARYGVKFDDMVNFGYQASAVESDANREAGHLRNRAGYVIGQATATGNAQASAGAAMAAGRAGQQSAYAMYGSERLGIAGYNEQLMGAGRNKEIGTNILMADKAKQSARLNNQEGRTATDARHHEIHADTDQGFINSIPIVNRTGLPSAALVGIPGLEGLGDRRKRINQERQSGLNNVTEERVDLEDRTMGQQNRLVEAYTKENEGANRGMGDKLSDISTKQAGEAAGAAWAGARRSIAGHREGQKLMDKATDMEAEGKLFGAMIRREAEMKAARERQQAQVLLHLGPAIASHLQHLLNQRF